VTRCLVFCRHCGFIIAEFEQSHLPHKLKCPCCGSLEKVCWQRHWNGKSDGLRHWMIATSVQGKLGEMFMLRFPRFDYRRNGMVSPVLNVR
jgi:phage FluMu protein Com